LSLADPIVELAGASSAARHEARYEALRRAYRVFPIFGALFLILALFVAEDLAADAEAGIGGLHMILEGISLGIAILGIGVAGRQFWCALRRADKLAGDLQRTRADADRWRSEAEGLLSKLGSALDQQFDSWGLTDAERGIAVLILKGLSYKEIASVRGTAERTVRHQALAIFRKAGLAGRAEMAAHFLESMLRQARRDDDEDRERDPAEVTPIPRERAQA
jgi:DNA-binding CsgD family transcriptional regulator